MKTIICPMALTDRVFMFRDVTDTCPACGKPIDDHRVETFSPRAHDPLPRDEV